MRIFLLTVFVDADWHEDCTSTDQAQICNDACFAGLGKCIEIECENNVDDHACIKDCSEAMIECDLKCPCEIGGECELGCPCPSFQCQPVCDEIDDFEPSQICTTWCFSAANETFYDCLYQDSTTAAILPTAPPNTTLQEPRIFPSKYESSQEDFQFCEKLAKEWSVDCQMGCPCNPNCPTCSQIEDTCKAEFCNATSTIPSTTSSSEMITTTTETNLTTTKERTTTTTTTTTFTSKSTVTTDVTTTTKTTRPLSSTEQPTTPDSGNCNHRCSCDENCTTCKLGKKCKVGLTTCVDGCVTEYLDCPVWELKGRF